MSSTYAENEVFSFCGHLEGELGGELKIVSREVV